jgi:hypothetical protein
MIRLLLLAPALAACVPVTGSPAYERRVLTLASQSDEVSPGLASCLLSIDRPDLAADPHGRMSGAEIRALVACTAERAAN